MHISTFDCTDVALRERAAQLLVEAFVDLAPHAWPNMDAARHEVCTCLTGDNVNLVARADSGVLLGWIGAIREYDGHAWELHPLAVREDSRRKGIGTALVRRLEQEVAGRGGITIYLGTDDESDRTSLSGVDLYPDAWRHVSRAENLRGHPCGFYQKLGYVITGVIPDANGPGKPDIIMARRVQPE